MPNLTFTNVWWQPANPVQGETITFYATEVNIGDAPAGPHTDRLMLDISIIEDYYDPGLPPGGSRTLEFTFVVPSAATYSFSIILDATDDVIEKDETNNIWSGIIIVKPPGIVVPEFDLSITMLTSVIFCGWLLTRSIIVKRKKLRKTWK